MLLRSQDAMPALRARSRCNGTAGIRRLRSGTSAPPRAARGGGGSR